jgi:hypothetical protein
VAQMSPPIMPSTWDPAMGIKFGGAGPQAGNAQGQAQGGSKFTFG